MNARLCSLLVAGGVVLAGVPNGSLAAAPPETEAAQRSQRSLTLQKAVLLPADGSGTRLRIEIPGYSSAPRVQVLSNPNRVVVDLPGVNRGNQLSKKDLASLTHPLIEKYRVAQFAVSPLPITRLVLEVVPGTQVTVSNQPDGIELVLSPGSGSVQAKYEATATKSQFQVAELAPAPRAMAEQKTEPVKPIDAVAPVPTEVISSPVEPIAGNAAAPMPASVPPSSPDAHLAEDAPKAKADQPAPIQDPVETAKPLVAHAAAAPTMPVPSIGAPYRLLPVITASALMPSTLSMPSPVALQPQTGRNQGSSLGVNSQSGRTLGEQEARYTGAPITIDIPSADLGTFLRIIADSMHLNLIMDQDVQGTYNFKFTDTPADLVLDMILKNAGLGKEISHGVLRVAKVEKLQKEENDRKSLDEAKALAGDLQSVSYPLSYAKVGEVKGILEKIITKRGSIITDERTNTMIITDLPRNLPLVADLIAQLDVQIQQVEISARVVEASGSFDKAFGVKWPTANGGGTDLTVNGSAATWGAIDTPSWNSINNRPGPGQNAVGLAFAPGKAGITDIAGAAAEYWVSFLSNRVSINFILQALEKEGKVKIVSQPKLVTQNNKAAKVLAGEKIPYPSQQGGAAGGAITVAFVEANLELDVTPQITNDGTILMDLKIEKSEADFSRTVQGSPTILRKSITTTVLVKDGGTAILGGVYTNNTSNGTTGVPFLSKLPLLGWLFRSKTNSEKNAELLIFITPRIIKN
ncbi:MAG: type IV pilus secretin PilQ [Acidobacteriota bacterium]|nr:type IV pilus secretin PilQ [Acidobacteriota bacterium]